LRFAAVADSVILAAMGILLRLILT
jgi:hypothetical protein